MRGYFEEGSCKSRWEYAKKIGMWSDSLKQGIAKLIGGFETNCEDIGKSVWRGLRELWGRKMELV